MTSHGTKLTSPSTPWRQQTTEASRRARGDSQFERVFRLLPTPAWILDRATLRFLEVNEAAVAVFGLSRDELLNMSYTALHQPEDVRDVRQTLAQDAQLQGSSAWRLRMRPGEPVLTPVAWRPVGFEGVPAILMLVEGTPHVVRRLIEDAEESRLRLEALSWRLVRIQENERSQISLELHDEVGQLLTGLKLLLATSWRRPGEDPNRESHEREEMMSIVSELMVRIRDLSMDLRPPMLDQLGLVATLVWYFERYTSRTGVVVSFQHDMGERCAVAIEITAFRIIQEALTNVARHADVKEATVEVRADSEGIWIVVEDKGRGFIPPEQWRGRSAGLIGMEERARLLGGHFTLETKPGAGTRIAVVLPSPRGGWVPES